MHIICYDLTDLTVNFSWSIRKLSHSQCIVSKIIPSFIFMKTKKHIWEKKIQCDQKANFKDSNRRKKQLLTTEKVFSLLFIH